MLNREKVQKQEGGEASRREGYSAFFTPTPFAFCHKTCPSLSLNLNLSFSFALLLQSSAFHLLGYRLIFHGLV